MKIIAECGATKSDWRLIDSSQELLQISEAGINVSTMPEESYKAVLRNALEEFSKKIRETARCRRTTDKDGVVDNGSCRENISMTRTDGNEVIHRNEVIQDENEATHRNEVTHIYIYVAGVITEHIERSIKDVTAESFPTASVEIQGDLIAAARAACGKKPGIVAILGTGSNSCQWDGENITKKVNSSGFILGDEGSASCLGKLFIADYLKDLIPDTVASDFRNNYASDYATIIKNVYCQSCSPSAYLGSFAPFILSHYNDSYIKNLVDNNFKNFFRRALKQYDISSHPIYIVGGFGHALKEIITKVAAAEGIMIYGFMKKPIEGLIEYHR